MPSLRGLTPLAVFLLLGLAVFALDHWRGGDAAPRTIEVTEAQLAGIRERWAAQWDRPPTDSELAGLVDDAVTEEILYREALRLGLDRDDTIVRRRLAQKITFMLEDGAAVPLPTDSELETGGARTGGRSGAQRDRTEQATRKSRQTGIPCSKKSFLKPRHTSHSASSLGVSPQSDY